MDKINIEEINEYESHLSVYYALKNRCSTLAKEEMLVSLERMYAMIHFI